MIGRLRERIRFERPVFGGDGAGGGALTWAPVPQTPEVFASVTAVTGSEPVAADQRQAQVTFQVTIRARDDLSAEWRIAWRGQYLDILAILPEPRRAYLTLLARSGGGQ